MDLSKWGVFVMYCDVSVIIPSLNPDEKLINTVNELEIVGFSDIIVVDDGSGEEYSDRFAEIENRASCTVLHHEVNKGKGAALKTAFEFVSASRPNSKGVITIDDDGQHLTKDIKSCVDSMLCHNETVLGCRDFSLPNVPPRSRFGNRMTSIVFRLFCGLKISDTQTGLRAIPGEFLPVLLSIKGDRYEYETNMLLEFKRQSIPYREETIETVYIDDNQSSHFRPIRDSLRIYRLILAYCLSSGVSTLTDLGMFFLLSKFVFLGAGSVIWSTVLARVISATVNFSLNRSAVFGNRNKLAFSLLKYFAVAVPIMLISAFSLKGLEFLLGLESRLLLTLFKMVVDTLLFFVSFRLQQNWVFKIRK